ncbi:transglycosylase SLT domain-containing protein [Nocardioides zeae]
MDVSARISQIQAQIAYLSGGSAVRSGASAGAAGGAASASATAFADALGAATGTSSTAATAGSSASAGSAAGGAVTGEDVVAQARRYLGVPYVWGGTDPAKGLDCSGLVQRVYDDLGIDLPRVSHQQARAGRAVEGGLANARPGDILAFNSPVNHVGIYIGDGKMIEAPRTGLDVRVIDVYETPTAVRRVLPEPGATSATSSTSATSALGGAAAQRRVADVPFASLFNEVGARYGVDPTLLAAIARQESAFDPRAVSPAGAQGLMQLMPATARGLGVANPYDPAQAVDGAGRLVRDLLTRFDRVDLALAAYNAGPGAVIRHGGVPPYAETQGYVRNVMQSWSAAR